MDEHLLPCPLASEGSSPLGWFIEASSPVCLPYSQPRELGETHHTHRKLPLAQEDFGNSHPERPGPTTPDSACAAIPDGRSLPTDSGYVAQTAWLSPGP